LHRPGVQIRIDLELADGNGLQRSIPCYTVYVLACTDKLHYWVFRSTATELHPIHLKLTVS
jgi:hypothetical protein